MRVKRDDLLESRRSGARRVVIGFTTKPDGLRRVRLADVKDSSNETRVRVDQLGHNYRYA